MPAIDITDVSEFTDPIQSLGDGDNLDHANLKIGTQGVANRTKFLYHFVTGFGRVVKVAHFALASSASHSSTSYANATGYEIDLGTLSVGDVVLVCAKVSHGSNNASHASVAAVSVVEAGAPTQISEDSTTTTSLYQSFIAGKTVTAAGQAYARIQHYISNGASVTTVYGAQMIALVVRP
jgi:hypothetical protein